MNYESQMIYKVVAKFGKEIKQEIKNLGTGEEFIWDVSAEHVIDDIDNALVTIDNSILRIAYLADKEYNKLLTKKKAQAKIDSILEKALRKQTETEDIQF